nr:MAG TPA: tail fiber-like protein [Caudoviricetes sp.]
MANVPKAITDLPVASAMGDDDLLVVSQNATTSSIKGELIKSYAQNAVASQVTAAQTAATQAANSATNAESARQGAEDAQEAAESAQTSAEQAATEATNAAGTIGDSVEQAQGYATQAGSARDAAISAQQAAETAEDNAVSAKTAAETAQTAAEGSATQAAGSATTAQSAATQAGDAKTDAETARNEAETSASSAANSASDAESAATEAEQAKTYIENMDMEGETLPAGSSVTVTKTTSPEGNLLFVIGVPQGIQGDKGDTGETGATGPQGVSVTNATVNEDGDLVITLSAGDPINAGSVIGPQGIQGDVGPTGASVDRIERTSGTGAPGTTDTYTVYLTDGQTGGTFQVYNGSNGTGSGDFMADGSVPMTGDLQMGGHKITNLAEPTDNTDAASKEYVDDTITVSLVGNYIPMGQKGQANGVASLDNEGKVPSAQLPPMDYVPTSRTVNGHALSADVTLDAEDVGARPDTWTPSAEDVGAIPNPSGGTAGQVLTKTANGSAWENAPSGLPDGGTEGQIIKKTADGAEWDDAEWLPLNGGTMSGDIAMGGHKITNLGAPTNANDAVRQADLKVVSDEVDGIISGTTGITLAPATTTKIGGVIVGDGIEVEADGTISTNPVPAGGTPGQLLTKTETGEEWSDAPSGLPEGGTEGQILEKTSSGAAWVDAPESGLTQEQADDRYLQLSGGTLTGALTLNGEPTEDLQAAPKQYVDALKPLARTITLTAAGWSSNAQTVTVSGVVASETAQLIAPTPAIASQSAYYEAGIMCTGQAANSLTFTCQTVPTSNLTVYVVIQPLN